MVIKSRIPILRRDGIVQHYHTTRSRVVKRGLEYDEEIDAWIDFSKFTLEPVPVAPSEVIPPSEPQLPVEPPFWTVMFYTDYKPDKERFEARVSVQARNPQEAEDIAMRKALTTLPDDYVAFLDALGVFESPSVDSIDKTDAIEGVQYFRYPIGGRRGDARRFGK